MRDTVIDESSPFYGFVDHVVVMGCTKYKLRQEFIKRELDMLGITSYTSLMQPNSSIAEHVLHSVPHRGLDSRAVSNTWFNHYYAIRLCHDMGYDRVLLLEDDAAFLTDHRAIREALSEVKDGYSLLLLDPVIMSQGAHAEAVKRGVAAGMAHWGVVTRSAGHNGCPRCAGCRILSKEAVSAYVDLHECLFTGGCPDGVLYPADMWHRSVMIRTGKPVLYAVPPLSTQSRSAERGPYTGYAHANYVSYGVDVSRYGHADVAVTQRDAGDGVGEAVTVAEPHLPEPVGGSVSGFGFGGVYAVCYTGNPRRHAALLAELQRVGLDAEIVWGFPSPYRDLILAHIPHEGVLAARPGAWGATLCQYAAIKTAYERGQDSVLIMEDDCRFLQDVSAVARGLLSAPSDWGILMLDYFAEVPAGGDHSEPVNGWLRVSQARSTACYALRRKAMERLIDMYESPVSGKYPNPVMRSSDHWLSSGYMGDSALIYASVPRLAVQQDCGDVSNWGDTVRRLYQGAGVDRSLYAPGIVH